MSARIDGLPCMALAALIGHGSAAFALDCDSPYRLTPVDTMEASDFTLRGWVLSREDGLHTVEVLELWKGEPPEGPVEIRADEGWGPFFEPGMDVLFYGRVSDDDGSLELPLCGRSGPFRPAEGEALGAPRWSSPERGVEFRRGDSDGDGEVNISDPIASLTFQFLGAFRPGCFDALDVDDSGGIDVTDALASLQHLFQAGAPPAAPFDACGPDPTADDLGCARFEACSPEPAVRNTIQSIVIHTRADRVTVTLHSTLPFPTSDMLVLAVGFKLFWEGRLVGEDARTVVFDMTVEDFDRTSEQAPVNAGPSWVSFESPEWRDFGLWHKGQAERR